MPERDLGTPITAGDIMSREGVLPPDPDTDEQAVNPDTIVDYVEKPLTREQMDKALLEIADQEEQDHAPQLPELPGSSSDDEETQPAQTASALQWRPPAQAGSGRRPWVAGIEKSLPKGDR